METLLTIGICILLILLEFAVLALIAAPRAVIGWLRRQLGRLWSAVADLLRSIIGGRPRPGPDQRAPVPE